MIGKKRATTIVKNKRNEIGYHSNNHNISDNNIKNRSNTTNSNYLDEVNINYIFK